MYSEESECVVSKTCKGFMWNSVLIPISEKNMYFAFHWKWILVNLTDLKKTAHQTEDWYVIEYYGTQLNIT